MMDQAISIPTFVHRLLALLCGLILAQACEEPVKNPTVILPDAQSYDIEVLALAQWSGQLEGSSASFTINKQTVGGVAEYRWGETNVSSAVTLNADGSIAFKHNNQVILCHTPTPSDANPAYECKYSSPGAIAIKDWLDSLPPHENRVLVSTGDSFGISSAISATFNDVPAIDLLNKVGLNYDTFGNHNLEKGLFYLQNLIDLSKYNYVVANLSNVPQNMRGVAPYAMKRIQSPDDTNNPLTLAIVGTVDHSAGSMIFPGSLGTTAIVDYCATKYAMQDAYKQGARAFVLLSHLAMDQNNRNYETLYHFLDMLLEMENETYRVCPKRYGWKLPEDETQINKKIFNGIIAVIGPSGWDDSAVSFTKDNINTLLTSNGDFIEPFFDSNMQNLQTLYDKIVFQTLGKNEDFIGTTNYTALDTFIKGITYPSITKKYYLCKDNTNENDGYCNNWDMYPDQRHTLLRDINLTPEQAKPAYSDFVKLDVGNVLFLAMLNFKYPDGNSSTPTKFDAEILKKNLQNSLNSGYDISAVTDSASERCDTANKSFLDCSKHTIYRKGYSRNKDILFLQLREKGGSLLKLNVQILQDKQDNNLYSPAVIQFESQIPVSQQSYLLTPADCGKLLTGDCSTLYEKQLNNKGNSSPKGTEKEKLVSSCVNTLSAMNAFQSTNAWACLYESYKSYNCDGSFSEPVVFTLDHEISYDSKNVRRQSTELGNLVTDAVIAYYTINKEIKVDMAIINGGAIRAGISKEFRVSDALAICPYANYIVIMQLTPRQIADVLFNGYRFNQSPASDYGGYLQVGGLRYKYDPTKGYKITQVDLIEYKDKTVNYKTIYHTLTSSNEDCGSFTKGMVGIKQGNETIEEYYCYLLDKSKGEAEKDQLYTLATLDYLYNGGDGFIFPEVSATIYERYDSTVAGFFLGKTVTEACKPPQKGAKTINDLTSEELLTRVKESRACDNNISGCDTEKWLILGSTP